jgi:hypothetical protein
LVAGAGPPSILYNHVNRSFRRGRGLFDLGVLVARPFFCRSWPLCLASFAVAIRE